MAKFLDAQGLKKVWDKVKIVTSKSVIASEVNKTYRGNDISSYYEDGSLWSRIAGTDGYDLFDDLYIGDYFTTGSASIAGKTNTWYWVIAGVDLESEAKGGVHHLVILPCKSDGKESETVCTSCKMYESAPFTGHYGGSIPHAKMIENGEITLGMQAIFGSHLLSWQTYISTKNESDGITSKGYCEKQTVYGILMDEMELCGSWVYSKNLDAVGRSEGLGEQLPLFKLNPTLIFNFSVSLWLRSVSSFSDFAIAHHFGYPSNATATASFGLRPRFLIG